MQWPPGLASGSASPTEAAEAASLRSHRNSIDLSGAKPAKEIFGDDVPWWIKNKAPLQISPSTKSINLMKEKFGEDFMTTAIVTASEDAHEATEADETIADEYEEEEEEEEEEEDVEQACSNINMLWFGEFQAKLAILYFQYKLKHQVGKNQGI